MNKSELIDGINRLREEKNAIILAHYYQETDIQDIADFVGDSLNLAKAAAETDADIIVFCGVHFMAEAAKIINPDKKVLLPDANAGCSLADGCPPEEFRKFKAKYPDHMVVTYINCSAEVKAETDIICTSSNAKMIIESIPEDQPIIFAPDKNLGKYLIRETGRDMVLWEGSCIVHEAFSFEKLVKLLEANPGAKIAAHPESEPHILRIADFVGSTAKILNYIKDDPAQTFIVATEVGILHKMKEQNPDKTLIPAPTEEDNACACSECAFMKMNTLAKLYQCLKDETPEIIMDEEIRVRALRPIERMLEFS